MEREDDVNLKRSIDMGELDRARRMLKEKNPLSVVDELRPWLKNNPDSAQGWELMGIALGKLGRWWEAEVPAGQRVRLEPNNAQAWSMRNVQRQRRI